MTSVVRPPPRAWVALVVFFLLACGPRHVPAAGPAPRDIPLDLGQRSHLRVVLIGDKSEASGTIVTDIKNVQDLVFKRTVFLPPRIRDIPGSDDGGFDDTPLASAIWPALTTIRQPIRDMSREAIGLLGMRLRSPDDGAHGVIGKVKLDYQLIRRQSDAVPARH